MGKAELWYDLETTGLNPLDGHAVVQFGGILVEDGEIIATIDEKINPYSYHRDVTINAKALEINGHKEEEFHTYTNLVDFMMLLRQTVSKTQGKVTLIGYNNSTFDKYFLEDMFYDCKMRYQNYFKWKQIDVFEIVKGLQHMGVMGPTFNQKLGTIAEYLEIEPEGSLHDALVDVKLTRGIYLKIKQKLLEA